MAGPIVCLSLVPAAGCNQTEIVYLLILWMFFYGFITGGEIPTVADMAPDIAGTVFGFANTWSCAMGIFAPMVMGGILANDVSNPCSILMLSYPPPIKLNQSN